MPQTPDVIVSLTRFTVSVLPANDVNHKAYALQVELKPHGWVVHDGHVYFDPDGSEAFSQSTAYHFADHEDALALAKRLAPGSPSTGTPRPRSTTRPVGRPRCPSPRPAPTAPAPTPELAPRARRMHRVRLRPIPAAHRQLTPETREGPRATMLGAYAREAS
ncbi:hypothetical protein ACFQ3Z_16395 [Streptomyces nogalater]